MANCLPTAGSPNRLPGSREWLPRLLALMISSAFTVPSARADEDGVSNYNHRCALCHTQTGAGVPGSFPPLRSQVVAFAKTPAGRNYLVAVVTNGRNGGLKLDGASYAGFMPPQGLSDAQAAAVLNYVVGTIASGGEQVATFTATEIAETRGRIPARDAESTAAMRPSSP
jgi:mono/diheme cytochrome c family protein